MVEIHNNIKEEPAWLFYAENKPKEMTVECILNTQGVTSIGLIENATAWWNIRAQVHREYKNGITGTYYVQYKGHLFEIVRSLVNETNATEFPFDYFDKVINYLLDIGEYPNIVLK